MSVTKADVLKTALRLAKAKQDKEKEPCVELTASTNLKTMLTEKNSAIEDVAKTLAGIYDVTFPKDVRTLGTIDGVAEYIVAYTDR